MGKDSWSKDSYRERDIKHGHHQTSSYNNRSYIQSNNRRSSEYHYRNINNDDDDDDYDYDYHDDYHDDYEYDDHEEQNDERDDNIDTIDGDDVRKYRYNRHNNRYNRNDNRNHHHHHRRSTSSHHHKNHRHKNNRSRSRSYERSDERNDNIDDRYQEGDGEDDQQQQQQQQQQEQHHQHPRREEKPNNTLMLRNIPPHIIDKNIIMEINQLGLYPKDVRLMRNKETGQSRGFAFIEFATIEQATQLKELTQNRMTFGAGEYECTLHYSFPKDGCGFQFDKNLLKSDWSCPKCGINNFKRRDECFKCGTSKDDNPFAGSGNNNNDDDDGISVRQPTNVLLIGNLSPSTTEEQVLATIGSLTALPIKSIRMINNSNRNVTVSSSLPPLTNTCCVELHSVYEATELYQLISSLDHGGLTVDNHLATISYGRRLDYCSSVVNVQMMQNAAVAALAAAQWKNLDDSGSGSGLNVNAAKKPIGTTTTTTTATVTLNGIKYQTYPDPDYNSFQYDHSSGYYYDSKTGFYYDSNSQYFYNSQTQKYMYYDTNNKIYITVDSNGQAINETTSATSATTTTTTTVTKPDEQKTTEDKAKIAKKIAKDMEKWAKTVTNNQRKELMTTKPQVSPQSDETSVLNQPQDQLQATSINTTSAITATSTKIQNPFDIIRQEEERLLDRERRCCMLCKRQFQSIELLEKHQQLSSLHKTNLSVLRQTLLNDEQLEHVEQVEREMNYRDRAKERREKYGIDDTPEISKRKLEYEKETSILMRNKEEEKTAPPISDDNIGNRMLKAMGWTEGTGLGKCNQGMSGIIEVERRKSGLGLGNQNATFSRESYKEAVRRTALQRFKEMSGDR